MTCELCRAKDEDSKAGKSVHRRVRILCLHGFRQNADLFKAKLSKLVEETKDIADYVFLDAPHTLPLLYRPRNEGESSPFPT